MTAPMTYVDAHCHIADLKMAQGLQQVFQNCVKAGISALVQGGVDPEDWQRQLNLVAPAAAAGVQIIPCFGIHPYTVAASEVGEGPSCDDLMDILARQISKAKAVGEMGLDWRPHIARGSEERQVEIFGLQLELAQVADKPVVLHVVQAHQKALQVLELWGVPKKGGMVHAFNGSAHQAQDYLDFGLYLSVGGPVCRPDNARLHQAVAKIPLEFLCLETDSPDQAPPSVKPGQNEPSTLLLVAEQVAKIKNLKVTEVLDRTSQNARKLFAI